jgi:hypothetical protein
MKNLFVFVLFFSFVYSFAGEGVCGNEEASFVFSCCLEQVTPYENYSYSIKTENGKVKVNSNISTLKSNLPYPVVIKDKKAKNLLKKASLKYKYFIKSEKVLREVDKIRKTSKGYFQAVNKVLLFVSKNFKYKDISDSELSGNCENIANLTVAICLKLSIPARVVSGIVVQKKTKVLSGAALHSFVEIFYPDYGWMFSDPNAYFHFVPATYIYIDKVDETALFGLKINRKKYLKNLQFIDILDNSLSVKSRVNLFKFSAN